MRDVISARRLYGAVFILCLRDTVRAEVKGDTGATAELEAWLRSPDGREVAGYAGFDLREATINATLAVVREAIRYRNPYYFQRGAVIA